MPITRSKSQLPPFTRLVHLGIALAFLTALFSAGRLVGLHVGAGLTTGALLLIWLVLMAFGLTSRRGESVGAASKALRLLLWLVLALTVLAGIGTYGFGYGAGPLAGLLAQNPELGQLAVQAHRPLALAALIIAAIHTFAAGYAKLQARRQRLRR